MKQSSDKPRFKNICNVSRETFNLLSKYEEILKKKNNEFNLIGKSTLPIIWTRHFADSLKLEATLELLILNYKKKIKICDVGSGAGFPGMILSILAKSNNWNTSITLIESNRKKADFLKKLANSLGLQINIINDRAENLGEAFDIITARAMANLKDLLFICSKLKHKKSKFVLIKGKKWEEEVIEAKKQWNFCFKIVKNNKLLDNTGGVTLLIDGVMKK